ncbi:hypothetical protein EV2_042998 [Malus domestica]
MCIRFFGAYLLAGILLLLPICYSDKAPDYTFVRESKSAPAVVHFDYIVGMSISRHSLSRCQFFSPGKRRLALRQSEHNQH